MEKIKRMPVTVEGISRMSISSPMFGRLEEQARRLNVINAIRLDDLLSKATGIPQAIYSSNLIGRADCTYTSGYIKTRPISDSIRYLATCSYGIRPVDITL